MDERYARSLRRRRPGQGSCSCCFMFGFGLLSIPLAAGLVLARLVRNRSVR